LKIKILNAIFLIILTLAGGGNDSRKEVVRILFTGDVLMDRGVREYIKYHGIGALFNQSLDSVLHANDYVIGNLECPATRIVAPINKKFIFRAEPEWLDSLYHHGFTHLNLANNHSMDQGREGLTDTEANIVQSGIIPLGYGPDEKKACKPYLIASDPRKIFVISSVQVPSENWTYLPDKACVCEESVDSLVLQIKYLRKREQSAILIVQLHWGVEHTTSPRVYQKQQARQLIDAGADCIIGHHTHTIQPVEWYNGKPIFYSLGNFIFDQEKPLNSVGQVVQMEIKPDTISYREIQVYSDPKHWPKIIRQ
jgi:poly-gamma-glutamate capsule biosynthesis protein CapA/YwtB (metallophosphatase superfamily)